MQRRTLKSFALATSLVVSGCSLDFLTGKPTGILNATPAPTTAPNTSATTTPQATELPGGNPTLPPVFNGLSDMALGFLVSNNAAGLKGSVFGPSTLVSNNAAGLVSNNAAGLVSNNAAGLVSNNAAGYRVATVDDVNVADGFVYLTTPDERLYVDADKKLYGTLTDKDGKFDMKAPAAKDLIVNVLLSGNRRLTALVNTEANSAADITVNLATTLVTEYLRSKAKEFGFTLADVAGNSGAKTILGEITTLTTDLVKQDAVLARLQPSDLAVNNIPVLRHRYVVAFGTGTDQALSDKWVAFLRAMKNDSASPDMVYRPLAVTTVDTGDMIPAGDQVLSVAVAPAGAANAGKIYVSHVSPNVTEILELAPGGGSPISLIKKARLGGDAFRLPGTLEALPDGRIVLMDSLNQWVALGDPRSGASPALTPSGAYFGFGDKDAGTEFYAGDYSFWKNPSLLVDVYCGTAGEGCGGDTNASVDDVAFDDSSPQNMYLADLNQHVVWKAADIFNRYQGDPLVEFAGKVGEVNEDETHTTLASLRFNQPAKVTFNAHGGNKYLFVADNGDHAIVRINLSNPDEMVKRVVGAMPPPSTAYVSSDGKKGPRKALCYSPSEEGDLANKAHLRFPQKMLFDSSGRMLVADGDNRLIRIATVHDDTPRVWTIAGRPQETNGACESIGLPPPFSNEDGEAKAVALGEVSGMALDPDGNLILSDVRSNRVRKIWTSFLK